MIRHSTDNLTTTAQFVHSPNSSRSSGIPHVVTKLLSELRTSSAHIVLHHPGNIEKSKEGLYGCSRSDCNLSFCQPGTIVLDFFSFLESLTALSSSSSRPFLEIVVISFSNWILSLSETHSFLLFSWSGCLSSRTALGCTVCFVRNPLYSNLNLRLSSI